jgi:transcriptional regulator of acetoin/glycerol metabolism
MEIANDYGKIHIIRKETVSLKNVERENILQMLERNNWNRLATANEMGIHKTTLFRKIKQLKIHLPEKDGRYNQ